MKKMLSVLLILAVIFSMAACGSGNGSTSNIPDQNGPSPTAHEAPDFIPENNGVQTENDDVQADDDTEASGAPSQDESLEVSDADDKMEQGSHILVAYFSRVGNTDWEDGVDVVTSASLNVENDEFVGNAEYLARMVQQATGGDLFLIQTEETYPSDYRKTTDQASKEQADNARPALSSHVEDMGRYDVVVLVYPNWWGTLPQALFTFLEEYDFSGKTILPLCTHEGSRLGSSEKAIAGLCPDATLLDGLEVRGSKASSAQSDVEKWINRSGILD